MVRSAHCLHAPRAGTMRVADDSPSLVATSHDEMAIFDTAPPIHPAPTPTLPDDAQPQSALIFVVEGSRYAIPLAGVLEVTPASALMSPSGSESTLVGYLDLRGEVLPVLDARRLLALPPRALGLADRFVVVRTGSYSAAIVVDRVDGVEEVALIVGPAIERNDGLTLGRPARAASGDGLVAFIDLGSLLAGSAAGRAEMAAS